MARPSSCDRGMAPLESFPVALHSRIVRFMAVCACDLLVPDVVARALSLAKNFKRCLELKPVDRWANATQAASGFKEPAHAARQRLRHERFQESWGQIAEKRLLERFAAFHRGKSVDNAAPRFADFARQEGILDVDEESLSQRLPSIISAQELVEDPTLCGCRISLHCNAGIDFFVYSAGQISWCRGLRSHASPL
jgi:hypothetical protein